MMTLIFCIGAGGIGYVVGNKLQEGCFESREWRLQNVHREGDHETSQDTTLGE